MSRRKGVDDDSSDEDSEGFQPQAETESKVASVATQVSESSDPKAASITTEKNSKEFQDHDNSDQSDEEPGDRASDNGDSSEESSDDDEEEMAKVREGFIVDSDSDDEGESKSKKMRKRRKRQKHTEEHLELDEEDLDLLGEARGVRPADGSDAAPKFKRLKRAAKESKPRGLDAIFDDAESEENESDDDTSRKTGRDAGRHKGEFDDFIEADEFSEDEDEALRREEEREIGRRHKIGAARASQAAARGLASVGDLAGLNEEKLSEIFEVFGDGELYDWALANEDEELGDGTANPPQPEDLRLTDVFEPSELAGRMLTTEDNAIRSEDLPERYQLMRSKLRHSYDLDDSEFFEKKQWIADRMVTRKIPGVGLREHTRQAINTVVECVSRQHLEVPFIWHHRQDYLVHFSSKDSTAERSQLLGLDDLWKILDLDMEFHALIERRRALRSLESSLNLEDPTKITNFIAEAATGVEFQDLVDYIQFVSSAQLRAQRRHSRFANFDRVRQGPSMELVEAIQIDVDSIGESLSKDIVIARSEELRDTALTPSEFQAELGPQANTEDAINFVAFALSVDPRVRRFFRTQFEQSARIDLVVTDDGKRKITSNSPFADLKYSANWTLDELRDRPALFLRMLKAESQGLLIVRAQYPLYKTTLYADFEKMLAGSKEDTADSWFETRRKVAKSASRIVVPLVARNILEDLRAFCVQALRYELRESFSYRLNQAPYKPPGYVLGTLPRVLTISAGEAQYGDAVLASVVDEDGHVSEVVKLGDSRGPKFRETLVQLVKTSRPDVVGVAGFTPAARRLYDSVKSTIVDTNQIMTGPEEAEQLLAVIWVQDEVARLYRHSERAAIEFPDLVPNARYCVALARYLQSPLLEYAQLEPSQLRNLLLHKDQNLLPDDEFAWATESAFVDFVCDEGVDINLAVRSNYHAAVLRYVAGLGPRKASGIIQSVTARAKAGQLSSRIQLVTAEITSRIVFMNCASFLRIPWSNNSSNSSNESEYLDGTRIHPEDYELARKMCADALELDEEDIEAIEDRQVGGVVGQLLADDPEGRKLEELVLEEYAEELEHMFKQKKRVTLIQIRQEIQDPYGELRASLLLMSSDQVFTMLTGETPKSFCRGAVVSGTVSKVTGRSLVLTLSGGIDAVAETGSISDDRGVTLSQQFAPGQALQAEILSVDYGTLFAKVNCRQSAINDALRRLAKEASLNYDAKHWNKEAEQRDHDNASRRAEQRQRQLRVIKHPLFRPFSSREAEAYLAPLQRGDLVIRPSSRGMDHLVVTWKVADQIYQHIDVLEQDKPNDYAVGRKLLVGPYRYADLDELIIMHVQSMARKVDEMCANEKFQKGNRHDVERWLSAYTNARPTQSVYAFCFDHRRPGYFLLSFMLGANQPIKDLNVKVLPNGYELLSNAYSDVLSLANGFKTMVQRSRV